MQTDLLWRPLGVADLPAVSAIAAQVHPAFPEDDAIFAERLRLYPDGMHLLEREGEAAGYIISHPWRAGTIPALNQLLHRLPEDADSFYLHDLALMPAAQGRGAARLIVERVVTHAQAAGFANLSLVAVNGSVPFWRSLGFAEAAANGVAGKLASYGAAARYMIRQLD